MPISISGMHRSGTSMVAKVLMDGGLYLGELAELMPAAAENPEGFWEYSDIVVLNDAIIRQLGGAWDLPPRSPGDWDDPSLAAIRNSAAAVLERFRGLDIWGWKDPRNCLTTPFWRSITGPLKVVFVIRGPLDVALSLQKRNGFTLPLGLYLWYVYNKRLLDDTTPGERLITHFDAYFSEPAEEVRRLLSFAGLPNDDHTVQRLARNASPSLKHYRTTLNDLLKARVSTEIIDLYAALCEEAGQGIPGYPRRNDDQNSQLVSRVEQMPRDGISRIDLWYLEQQRRTNELEVALAVQEGSRSELEGRISERDGMILEREGRISERDTKLTERDRTVSRLSQELLVLRQAISDQTAHIEAMTERLKATVEHEQEMRDILTSTQNQLLLRDVEMMGTLGAALAPWAPAAPAAIYYRQLVGNVRAAVNTHIPEQSILLVASYGDPSMTELGNRTVWEFPQTDGGIAADYTMMESTAAIEQIQQFRNKGARFLVAPSPAQTWLARLPELSRFLDAHFPVVAHQLGVCTIYRLHEDEAR